MIEELKPLIANRSGLIKEEYSIRVGMKGKSSLTVEWKEKWERMTEIKQELIELQGKIHELEINFNINPLN